MNCKIVNPAILAGSLLVLAGAQARADSSYSFASFSKESWSIAVQDGSIGEAIPSWFSRTAILKKTGNKNLIPVPALEKGYLTFALAPESESDDYYRVVFKVLDRNGDDGGQLFVAEKGKPVSCLAPKEKQPGNVYLAMTMKSISIAGDQWPKAPEGKGAAAPEGVAATGL